MAFYYTLAFMQAQLKKKRRMNFTVSNKTKQFHLHIRFLSDLQAETHWIHRQNGISAQVIETWAYSNIPQNSIYQQPKEMSLNVRAVTACGVKHVSEWNGFLVSFLFSFQEKVASNMKNGKCRVAFTEIPSHKDTCHSCESVDECLTQAF